MCTQPPVSHKKAPPAAAVSPVPEYGVVAGPYPNLVLAARNRVPSRSAHTCEVARGVNGSGTLQCLRCVSCILRDERMKARTYIAVVHRRAAALRPPRHLLVGAARELVPSVDPGVCVEVARGLIVRVAVGHAKGGASGGGCRRCGGNGWS